MNNNVRWLEDTVAGKFEEVAIRLFHEQYDQNTVYNTYCQLLGIRKGQVNRVSEIPFLPISFFKTHSIVSKQNRAIVQRFTSSGTTTAQKSTHELVDLLPYHWSLSNGFDYFFGSPKQYCFLALLPNYLDNPNSSLVHMVHQLMTSSNHPKNGFYLDNRTTLVETLTLLEKQQQPTVLFGVSFALLDLAAEHSLSLPNTIIIETGGMKGRRKEITREALHADLKKGIQAKQLCSEYGMTELLSQAYALDGTNFSCPPWMHISIREVNDPFHLLEPGKTGGINVIDLANRYSCPFIATQDLGRLGDDGHHFEVLGRFDDSDARGCNLLVD